MGDLTEPTRRPRTLTRTVRDAVAFDAAGLTPVAGLRAAAGLTAALLIGLAAGGPTAAVIAATGALVIGIVSLTGGVRPPLMTMTLTALAQATSIFVGSTTGQVWVLHVVVMVLWAFAGGLLVALGQGATTVGLQAIVAFVVFGRFSQAPAAALQMAGIALGGAALQVALTGVVRWPEAFRAQRQRLAAVFGQLAALARGVPDASGLPSAQAADAAEQLLAGTSLLARDDGRAMRGLLDEARRVRLALLSLSAVRRRLDGGAPITAGVDALLGATASVLDDIPGVLAGGDHRALDRVADQVDHLTASVRTLAAGTADRDPLAAAARDSLGALAGQLRAVVALLEEIWHSGGARLRLPRGILHRDRNWADRARSGAAQLRANLSPRSAAFRHAARMGVLVPASSVAAQHTALARGYWIPLTVAVVLRPDFTGTFTRGIGRTLGTSAGVAAAGLAVAVLHPGRAVSIVAIGLAAWATYSLFSASYAAFIAFLTAVVVLMLGLLTTDTIGTAVDRLVDTLIGGALALIAYAVWPTWSMDEAWAALGDLLAAQRRYLRAVLDRIAGSGDTDEAALARLARQARMARSNANAVVDRSLGEPSRHRIDPERTAGILAALRRLSEATHLLRTRTAGAEAQGSVPAAAPLATAIDSALATLAAAVQGESRHRSLPPLRRLHDLLGEEASGSGASGLVVTETDEIVDAIDTVGHLVGVEPAASR
jgi:uncharacterized membrane protein YccC